MKLKSFTIFALTFAILLTGQSAVAASTNVTSDFSTDGWANGYDVDIYFVGTDGTTFGELDPVSEGFYFVESNATQTQVTIKANATGISGFYEEFVPYYDDPEMLGGSIVGQLFVVIDGDIAPAGIGALSDSGYKINLKQGTHTVTWLYINKGNDGMEYASDTVTIRVGAENVDFGGYTVVPTNFDVEELAVAGLKWNASAPGVENEYGFVNRGAAYSPVSDVNITYIGATTEQVEEGEISNEYDYDNEFTLNVTGWVNSTGTYDYAFDFEAIAYPSYYPAFYRNRTTTVGYNFYADAMGLHYYTGDGSDEIEETYLYTMMNGSTIVPATFVGVFTIADYGWQDGDFDGLGSTPSGSSFDYSIDFGYTSSGAYFIDVVDDRYTVTVDEAPGFGALETAGGLFTLGIFAFIMPRLRKKE